MKKLTVFCVMFFLVSPAFSMNGYQRCIEECLASGGTMATCAGEVCDPTDTIRDVVIGQGNPLYLFSYELKGPSPVINGSLLSRNTDPGVQDAMDEWKSACSRTLVLTDTGIVQLFLTNSPDTLYVGITYEHGNNGDGSGVRLLFDQGNNVPPSEYHGSTDLKLMAPNGICNEQGCEIFRAGGDFIINDLCWNGSSWIKDKDGKVDFKASRYYNSTDLKVHHAEFAIPLKSAKANDKGNSDLTVNPNDVIGFYLDIIKTGSGAGMFSWKETNGNAMRPDTFPFWAKIQLSVKRDYFTLYPGRSPNPPPVLDGAINEAVWNGAYQREMVLSNFHYSAFKSKIWCLEDSAQNYLYVGLRVYDKKHNAQDACQLFFEEDGTNTTNAYRNYTLETNAENSLKITNGNQLSNQYWNIVNRTWTADPAAAADSQSAKAGDSQLFTDYEFRVKRSGGTYNIDIPKGGYMGFLIRYHDADQVAEHLSNYYWEYTTNNDAQLLQNRDIFIATGWSNIKLGGPYVEVVSPKSSIDIHGIVPIVVSSGQDSLKAVYCFLASDTLTMVTLTQDANGVWKGSLDATNAVGDQTLIIRAISVNDIAYERIINKAENIGIRQEYFRTLSPSVSPLQVFAGREIRFLVSMEQPGPFSLDVYNLAGKKVWTYSGTSFRAGMVRITPHPDYLNIGDGSYLAAFTSKAGTASKKFTVLR